MMLSNPEILLLASKKCVALAVLVWFVAIGTGTMIAFSTEEHLIAGMILSGLLVWMSFIDFEKRLLPNLLTYPLLCAGLIWTGLIKLDQLPLHIFGAMIGYFVIWCLHSFYKLKTGKVGIGLGDAKLFAGAGAWLGPLGLPYVMLIASFSAIVSVIPQLIHSKQIDSRVMIAFGPYLSFGIWVVWLLGFKNPFSSNFAF